MSELAVVKPDAMESSLEFAQGRDAFRAGEADKCCPYHANKGNSPQRTSWMFGYWGERTDTFLSRLEKNGNE